MPWKGILPKPRLYFQNLDSSKNEDKKLETCITCSAYTAITLLQVFPEYIKKRNYLDRYENIISKTRCTWLP